jgi:hypothetical protein
VAASSSPTVHMLTWGSLMATPLFYSQARRDHKPKSSLWVPSRAFTNCANPTVINSDRSLDLATEGVSCKAEAPAPPPAFSLGLLLLDGVGAAAGAIDELLLPNDFNHQHKHPEPDDDDGLRLSLRLTFSCGDRGV